METMTLEHSNDLLVSEKRNGVATLTLNRPKAYNALSLQFMELLITKLKTLDNDPTVRVLVLAGAGKGFCAGHDLLEIQANPSREFYERTFKTCSKMMLTITELSKPVIARVHGIATGAGCQLVATCDLAVAEEFSRFATPGVNISLFCSTPMVALSRVVPRKQAMAMLLLGEKVSANQACEMGLINKVVPAERLALETQLMAEIIADKSPLTVKIGKKAFYRQIECDLSSAYEYCSKIMTENLMTRDAEEGINAFIEKREPVWYGE